EKFADELIDGICPEGRADIIAEYAMLLPVRVLTRLYGFTDDQGPALVTALNDTIDGRERAIAGQTHLFTSTTELGALRRGQPGDDVGPRLLADTPGFADEGIVQDLVVGMAAGHQPTADWIGNSLHLRLTDSRFAASLFGGRNSVAEAMNEVLWEDTPTQNVAGRWASRDTQIGRASCRERV